VSGIRNTKLVVMTDSGVFTFMPKMIQIHDKAKAKINTSPKAISTPRGPPAGRNPRIRPSPMIRDAATE